MDFLMLSQLREIYSRGENISSYIRRNFKTGNDLDAIKISYDLQAGSYIKSYLENGAVASNIKQIVPLLLPVLNRHIEDGDCCLDFGTGEMTMLTSLFNQAKAVPSSVFACDISWSRLYHGITFLNKHKCFSSYVFPLVCNGVEMPFGTSSIDVTITSHALEPNRNDLNVILKELFRVTAKKCIFVEPSYEVAAEEVKSRMDALGYIRELEKTISELGAEIIEKRDLSAVNPKNPSVCYVVKPPKNSECIYKKQDKLTVPGTDLGLIRHQGFYFSEDAGVAFPSLLDIPILETKSAIIATSLIEVKDD